jgi:hypothetical protein
MTREIEVESTYRDKTSAFCKRIWTRTTCAVSEFIKVPVELQSQQILKGLN